MTATPDPAQEKPLSGCNILVTRPKAQAEALCEMINARGGHAVRLPSVEIAPLQDNLEAARIFNDLACYDWLFFISANAVYYAQAICEGEIPVPKQLKVAAVGKSTANALKNIKIKVDLLPKEQFNSEALLALPEMHSVYGQKIIIVRGEGGREHLAERLKNRGAEVVYAEVYRRLCPETTVTPLLSLWKQHGIHVVTITSTEILRNLITLLGAQGLRFLKQTPVVVASDRIAQDAKNYGLSKVVLAANPTNCALLDATVKICSDLHRG